LIITKLRLFLGNFNGLELVLLESIENEINLRDTGTEIGFACARVLALSSFSLISSLIVSGSLL
jgi:hypothetical protein